MIIRLIGAIMIISGCGSLGFSIAIQHKREVATLEQLLSAIEYMRCELEYRLTPLPALCRLVAASSKGKARDYFIGLLDSLKQQVSPDVSMCSKQTIDRLVPLSPRIQNAFTLLGNALGHFDVSGQVQSLNSVYDQIKLTLQECRNDQHQRLRSYQTLGLCAGASLAILFI